MRRFLKILGWLLLGLGTTTAAALGRDYALVTGGKTDARIQMNPRPTAPEFRAAKEIQDYVKKISGAQIDRATYPAVYLRVTGGNPDFLEILPVTLDNGKYLMPAGMQERLSKSASREAFYIKTAGNRIIIGGKTPIAVLYGAYAFIEKHLGVRWFHPGADGEYCPRSPEIRLGEIDDFEEPAVAGRSLNCWTESVKPWTMDEVRLWEMRNKIQFGSFYQYNNLTREQLDEFECGNQLLGGGGHLTFEAAVPKKLFASHPEYFPLKDGKRVCEERSQRCLANREVQKMVADYVAEMAAYGAEFSISYHDSSFDCWCQCPECLKMGTYAGKFTVSNLAHRFCSLIADEVLKRHPQAKLTIDMYNVFRDVPTDPSIRYDPRVAGTYCPHQRCYVHRLDDAASECNVKFYRELVAWQKMCPRIGIFDYYCCSKSPYTPMEYILADDIKLYKKIGLDHWIEDSSNGEVPYLSSNWRFYYVAAKMLWDASLDVNQLLLDADEKYYGAAREPMKKYHALRRELWEGAPGHAGYSGPVRVAYCLIVPRAEERLKALLDEAEKLAGNDALLRRRIAADREWLQRFWVQAAEKLKKQMSGQNEVPVAALAGKIRIDGSLDEEDWRTAQRASGFLTTDEKNQKEPVEETRVRVLYDENNWYLGIEAMTEHAWSPLKADAKTRDGEVYKDDSVEVFLAPPDSDYYHLIVNSAGVLYDAKLRDTGFDSQAEIKTRVLKDRYLIEARVPAEPMGVKIRSGQVWKMLFYRTCRNLQPPHSAEGSSLDGAEPHDTTGFRRAVVGKSAINNGNFEEIATDEKTGKRFPQGWGGAGRAALAEGTNHKNRIELTGDGCIFSWMPLRPSERGNTIGGAVTASGQGRLTVSLSTCIRAPGDRRGFGHEQKREAAAVELTETPTAHPFTFELAPYETGYIYVSFHGKSALIQGVNAARSSQ
jgi:hypothetical protein